MEISAISEAAAGAVEIFCWEQLVLCGNCLWSSRDLGLVIFYSSLCPQAATAALKGLRFFKFFYLCNLVGAASLEILAD